MRARRARPRPLRLDRAALAHVRNAVTRASGVTLIRSTFAGLPLFMFGLLAALRLN
jgi:hypothetical protein